MARTIINAKGTCKYCQNDTPKDCTITWISTNQSNVTIEIYFPDCGHRYREKVKFRQWQGLLNLAHENGTSSRYTT